MLYMALLLNRQWVCKANGRSVNLNDEAVCKMCFLSTFQNKKFSKELFQRSSKTAVITSQSVYVHLTDWISLQK